MSTRALGGRCFGGDHRGVFETEPDVAMDEGGGAGRHPVVGAAPGGEVQFPRLACDSSLGQMAEQGGERLRRERPRKELRFHEMSTSASLLGPGLLQSLTRAGARKP